MPDRPITIDSSGLLPIRGWENLSLLDLENDFAWHAVARMRFCRAYCHGRIYDARKDRTHTDSGLIPGDQLHTPACAYATDRWIPRAIAILRQVNERR